MTFLDFGIIDFIDIFIVAYLLYQFYMIIRGTSAMNVFVAIFSVYLVWLIVKALQMELLSSILGHVMGVGVLAVFIVFQQEIRKFLLMFVNKYSKIDFSVERLFRFFNQKTGVKINFEPIINACKEMSVKKTGVLIVIPKESDFKQVIETGDAINAPTSSQLLQTIFFKNSPMHDGAVIIFENTIVAASCVLPITNRGDLPKEVGLRHRAAVGATENTDAFAIIISEERGHISYSEKGRLITNIKIDELEVAMKQKFDIEKE